MIEGEAKKYAEPFLKAFDKVLQTPVTSEKKIEILNEILCGLLGHTTSLMYYMDSNFYSAGTEKGVDLLSDFLKEKIKKSAKERIQFIWLINTEEKGSA